MKSQVKVIKDSVSEYGDRLTTVEVTYHHFIHPHWMTYRTLSRNSASSRAIPIEKNVDKVLEAPAYPFLFGTNQPGMQAGPPLEGDDLLAAQGVWLEASLHAVNAVVKLHELNVHKEIANRLLEPFLWHTVIYTANNFDHMIHQRVDLPGAQEEIKRPVAELRDVLAVSEPTILKQGEYHLPYITDQDDLSDKDKIRVSIARCARVSYLNHDGTQDLQKDLNLFRFLVDNEHFSPLEHQATPSTDALPSNIAGWNQVRKLIEFEQLVL